MLIRQSWFIFLANMPPPPPPGPPAPPPPGPARPSGPAFKPSKGGGDRGDLLKSIQKGTKLKKVETNDRSSPILGNNKNSNSGGGGGQSSRGVAQNQAGGGGQEGGGAPGPLPGIGGLFAGGMPKLKSRGGVQTGRAVDPSMKVIFCTTVHLNWFGCIGPQPQQERGTPPNKWGQSSSNNLDKPYGSSSSSLVSEARKIFWKQSYYHHKWQYTSIWFPIFNSKLSERPERYKSGGSSYIHFLRVIIERLSISNRFRICLKFVSNSFQLLLSLIFNGSYTYAHTHIQHTTCHNDKRTIMHISCFDRLKT